MVTTVPAGTDTFSLYSGLPVPSTKGVGLPSIDGVAISRNFSSVKVSLCSPFFAPYQKRVPVLI